MDESKSSFSSVSWIVVKLALLTETRRSLGGCPLGNSGATGELNDVRSGEETVLVRLVPLPRNSGVFSVSRLRNTGTDGMVFVGLTRC